MNFKILLPFVFLVFLAAGIYAQCNSTQIDINSANSTELDKLYEIGPAKAQNIISYREDNEFNSVNDLINVSGIGTVTLEEIKQQGLACVNPVQKIQQDNNSNSPEASEQSNTNALLTYPTTQNKTNTPKNITQKVIELIPKNPSKTEKSWNILEGGNLPLEGLIAFGILLTGLFISQKFKTKRYKSEFN